MTARSSLLEAIEDLSVALKDLKAPAMVIGGIAVIAHGVPRSTLDIDATVWGEDLLPHQILDLLADHEIAGRIPDAEAFAARSQVLLMVHEPTGIHVALSLAWLPFERRALERAVEVRIGGATFLAATPEDLVLYKAVAWRDRDRSDIETLLLLHRSSIDLERVRALVKEFGVALDDPDRIQGFEAILRRVSQPEAGES